MTPPTVAELMAEHFPWVESHEREWLNVHDGTTPKLEEIAKLIERHIDAQAVLVLVLSEPEVAAMVKTTEAPAFIGSHILKARIHVANPQFTGFLVIQPTGVATGWNESK